MLEKMAREIRENGDNIFELVCVRDGVWETETLRPTAPCQNCYSLTKNFTATAIGMLQDRGLLTVEDPILPFFAGEAPAGRDDKLERVKIRHLLTQTMGNESGYLFEADRFTHGEDDWVKLVLSRPLAHEPGTKFVYSNSTYYLLSCIVRRVTGKTMERFLHDELFGALGITDYAWAACPLGETSGATGLYLPTADIAKLGLLYLNRGVYAGRRLLSEAWVDAASRNQVNLPGEAAYGFSFWMNGAGYEGNGAHNQILLILPGENLVLAGHGYMDGFDYLGALRRVIG